MRLLAVLFAFAFVFAVSGASACELGIYTYDSIAGKGGLGPLIFPEFEKLTGCKVRVIASGDAIETLSRAEIDLKRGKPAADVILGLDALSWARAKPLVDSSVAIDPVTEKRMEPVLREPLSRLPGFQPYDFGALALLADSEQLVKSAPPLPKSLDDLLKPEWRKNFILEDPRTSSPGLQFLLMTRSAKGSHFKDYWKKLRGQWLAMPPGWNSAYGLFLRGRAPLVWTYVTSEAYHREHGSTRYKAILLSDGQPIQIEGAVVVRGAAHRELAGKFMHFLVSDWVQNRVAATNWMWPVRKSMFVPPSFAKLPRAERPLVLSGADSAAALKEWSEAIHE